MAGEDVIFAVGPAEGGVGDVFAGGLAALRRSGRTVIATRLSDQSNSFRVALDALRTNWRLLRQAGTVHVEFGSNDVAVFWFGVLATLVRRDVVVVIHDPRIVAKAPGAGLVAKRKRWHSTVAYRILSPLLDRSAVTILLRRSGSVVVLGPAAQADLRRRTPRPVVSTALGADTGRGARRSPSACEYVLFAGYLGPHKGLEMLIESWAAVGSAGLRLVIVGAAGPSNGEWVESLKARASGLTNPPIWVGHVESESDFQAWFDEAAIVVLPYQRSSPASGILVRAMAAGRCVVATRVDATMAAIEDDVSGLLVDIADVSAFTACLKRAVESGAQRDRLGAGAQRQAASVFGWDRFVAGVEEAYELARAGS